MGYVLPDERHFGRIGREGRMDGTTEVKASPYRGSGVLTREQFLLREMRVIAKPVLLLSKKR